MFGKRVFSLVVIGLGVGFFLAPEAKAASANKFVVAVSQEPGTMDQSLGWMTIDYVISDNWAEYLIYKAPNGKLGPGLATSWKVSPDGKEIDFILRKGVKFHSGDPMTAKDIQFSFERGQTKNQTVRTRLKSIERYEIVDDYHFRIHFKEPDVTFIPNRGGVAIVSKSYYDRVGEEKFSKQPVGSGPYKFVNYVPGEYVDIERFDGYWGEKPPVKEARFYFVPEDATRVAKLKAGEVDLINNCSYASVKDIDKSPDLKTVTLATNHPTVSVIFSNRNPNTPWHNKKVRLAMAYAIDCDAIIKNVLHGVPNRWAFLAPYELGYDSNLKPYPYDPKKAKELLAEAGYPKGFDLKFYWVITGLIPMTRETAEAIASYWEAIGIRTKLIGEEYATAYARRRVSKGPEVEYVAVTGHGRAGSPDPTYYIDLFFGSEGSFSVYYNPELEKINAEGRATVNDAKRGELIKKAIRLIQDEVASIPIFNPVSVYAMKKNVDFKPTQEHVHDLVLIKDVTLK